MRIISKLWASLEASSFPISNELTIQDRDAFTLLDTYLSYCVEEWFACNGQISALSVVLLDNCTRTTKDLKHLDGEGQCYFGQWRQLARRMLRGIDVKQAKQELVAADLDWGDFLYASQLPDFP